MGTYSRLSLVWVPEPKSGFRFGSAQSGFCRGVNAAGRTLWGQTPHQVTAGLEVGTGGQSQAKAVAEPVPGSLSPGGAEAPNPTPKGTGTVRDGHRAEHSPPCSAAPVGSAPGSSNPLWKRLQQLPNPASPSRCLPLSEGNLPQLLCRIVL